MNKTALAILAGIVIHSANAEETRHYRYDAMHRLIGVEYQGQGAIEYTYDNLGNRMVETQQTGTLPINQPPTAVQAIAPPDGATAVVSTFQDIAWTQAIDPDAGDSVNYYLYLGKTPNPPLVHSGAETLATVCFKPNSTYYWQVTARDNHNLETPSAVWSFKTAATGHAYCDLIEGFDAADALDKLPWSRQQPTGNSGWQQGMAYFHTGAGAIASPQGLKNSQKASVSIKLTVTAGNIEFWYSISSAKGDYLNFYVDNVLKTQWQGEIGWTKASFSVGEGAHTFTWEYSKNASGVAGQDRAWIDTVSFPFPNDSSL